jgi:hypothetical protein
MLRCCRAALGPTLTHRHRQQHKASTWGRQETAAMQRWDRSKCLLVLLCVGLSVYGMPWPATPYIVLQSTGMCGHSGCASTFRCCESAVQGGLSCGNALVMCGVPAERVLPLCMCSAVGSFPGLSVVYPCLCCCHGFLPACRSLWTCWRVLWTWQQPVATSKPPRST